jgi:hypothetical protein
MTLRRISYILLTTYLIEDCCHQNLHLSLLTVSSDNALDRKLAEIPNEQLWNLS